MKKLHTLSKIFFSNPTVVSVLFENPTHLEYRRFTKEIYHLIKGTWGFSNYHYETKIDNGSVFSVRTFGRAYFCFKEDEDVLIFLLSSKFDAKIVKMWPDNLTYTIHEYIEEDQQ